MTMIPRHRASSTPLAAHRHLALAVVRQAVTDAVNPSTPASERQSARRFLAGNGMFRFWSSVVSGKRQAGR
jgi:hypothetical protein